MKLDIQPLNHSDVKLDIQPLDIQPLHKGVEDNPDFLEQLKVAAKQGFVSPGNAVDSALSGVAGGIAHLFNDTDLRDKIFKEMEARKASRNQWANPDNIKPGITATVLGTLPNIPAQMLSMPGQPFETGQDMIKRGEPMLNAQLGQVVTGGMNSAGAILGPMGKTIPTQVATGAIVNAAQSVAQKKALQAISNTEEGKQAYEVTPEETAVAALLGAGFGAHNAASKGLPWRTGNKPAPALDPKSIITQAKLAREAEAQARLLPENEMNVEGDLWRKQAQQTELPFSTGIEEIASHQRDAYNPNQMDMFLDNSGGERSPYPATEKLQVEQAQIAEQLRRVQAQKEAQITIEHRQQLMEHEMQLRVAYEQNLRAQAQLRGMNDTGFSKWEANRNVDDATRSAEQLRQLNEQGQQMGIVEDYGNHNPMDAMPNMRIDENGMPIRADLSMEVQNMENPLQRNLWGDELSVRTGDGGIPLTQAMDQAAAKQAPWQDVIGDQFKGGAPMESSALNTAVEQANNQPARQLPRGPRSQQGSSQMITDIAYLAYTGVRKLSDFMRKQLDGELPSSVEGIDYLGKTGLYNSKLYPGEDAETAINKTHTAIEKATALGKSTDSNLWINSQAGPVLAGEKIKSTAPWVQTAGRWMAWTSHATDYAHKKFIQPLEQTYNSLSKDQLIQFAGLMKEMQLQRTALSAEELAKAGVDPKIIKVVEHYRQEDARAFNALNASRKALGKPEITSEEAHFHSHFQGDFQIFVRDKNGNMLWPVHARSKAEAAQAATWLKEHFKNDPTVAADSINVKFSRNRTPLGKNSELLSTLGDFQKMFPEGSDGAALVQQVLQKYLDQQGNNALGQNLMQEKGKANMRGFEGDKPWKDDHQNARDYLKASTQNMLDQHRWAAMQQMVDQVKKMVTDPVISKEQPNNVALVKAHLLQSMGISGNIWREAQAALSNLDPTGKLTSTSLNSAIRGLKSIGYATTLGFSTGYAIATPFQAVQGTMGHLVRSINLGELSPQHIPDMLGGIFSGMYSGLTGAKPFTTWSKDALAYARDNGIATNILLDNDQNIGGNKALGHLSSMVNFTISRPDQVCRLPIFMSFASALEKSGKFESKEAAFQRAGEITESIMISMKKLDRPLWIDKLGPVGEAAYMFKAPLVNMWNTLSLGAHDIANAKGANAKMRAALFPLTYLATAAFMGGVHNLPIMEETESIMEAVKGIMAEHFPTVYEQHKDSIMLSPKDVALRTFPSSTWYGDIINYGAGSTMTGLGLTSRFGGGAINAEDPLNAISPLAQEFKEWGAAAASLAHPNSATISNAVREQIPNGLRGLYELNNPMYTSQVNEKGDRLMLNPKSITGEAKGDKWYTPEEQTLKKFGLRSFDEQKWRTENAIATKQQMNDRNAAKASIEKLTNALYRNDPKDAVSYATAAIKLTGNSDQVGQAIMDSIPKQYADKEQYLRMHPASMAALLAIQKLEEIRK